MPTVDTVAESDHHLLQRVASGDAVAWERLVERNASSMLRAALAACGNRDVADDAVQEAFLLVRTAAASYRARGEDPERTAQAWLVAVAANVALQLGRGRRRRDRRERGQEGPIMAITATGADPAAIVARRDNAAWIRGALAELSESDRRPLVLRYFAGLDHHGLAAALGCSPDSARARVHRALTRLRKRLRGVGVLLAVAALNQALGAMAASAEGAAPTAALFSRCSELIHAQPAPAVPAWAHTFTGVSTMTMLGLTTAGLLLTGGAVFGLFHLNAADAAAATDPAETTAPGLFGATGPAATTEPRSEPIISDEKASHTIIQGVVAAVRMNSQGQQDLVMLAVGGEEAVEEGTEFIIYRANQYICKVRCERGLKDMAACRVIPKSWNSQGIEINQGDLALQARAVDAEAKAAADAAGAAHQAAIDAARPAPKKSLFGG